MGIVTPPRTLHTGQQPGAPNTPTPEDNTPNIANIMLLPLPSNRPLTKGCMELSLGTDLSMAVARTSALYVEMLTKGARPSSTNMILTFGDQPAPFPFLAMTTNNTGIVLHRVKQLVIPYSNTHLHKGKIIGFLGNTNLGYGVPPIVHLETKDFDEKTLFHLELAMLHDTYNNKAQTLPIPEKSAMENSPKIIPTPLFLIPFFVNGGKPLMVINTLNAYQQKFLSNANPELSQHTKHILHFLLAPTRHNASTTIIPPISQLAIQMEALLFDQVLTHWATNQFAEMWQIARVFDTKQNKQPNPVTPVTTQNNPGNTQAAAPPGPQPAAQITGTATNTQQLGTAPVAPPLGMATRPAYPPGSIPTAHGLT